MNLDSIHQLSIDGRFKGIPAVSAPFFLKDIHQKKWNVLKEDMELPLVVLKDSALKNNSQWMQAFIQQAKADICPHGKTTMSPQLFQQQLQDGAWGMTIATVGQLKICRKFGVPRVFMANQLVGTAAIRWVLDALHQDPTFDFYGLVDSVKGVELVAQQAQQHPVNRPLQLFIEMGIEQGRTGFRDIKSALAAAHTIQKYSPHVCLRGIAGYEGLIASAHPSQLKENLCTFLQQMMQVARQCDQERLFAKEEVILTAGGSAYYDIVLEQLTQLRLSQPVRVVTRSGCYLTHDSGMYQKFFEAIQQRQLVSHQWQGGFQPALELWAYVQSHPEPNLMLLNFGKRDCSYDIELPIPQRWFSPAQHNQPVSLPEGYKIFALNDQHAYLRTPQDSPLQVGDMVISGISHPCTTFDKWQLIPVVDDHYQIISAIKTFF